MDTEFQELESQLKAMAPTGLNEDLLARLGAAMCGDAQTTAAELRPLESSMSKLEPATVPARLGEQLEGELVRVPFPVDEKVVLFPRGSKAESRSKKVSKSWLGIAAAVAIAGALSAMLISPKKESSEMVFKGAPLIESGAFVPAAYDSGVSDTADLGVLWSSDQKPMRVVRVVYVDRVDFVNDKGEKMTMEVPRVEYLVVPQKID